MYQFKNKNIKLCSGNTFDKNVKCIHRFRCYRFSLFQDAIFKGISDFKSIEVVNCISPKETDALPFKHLWIPNNIPEE